jgi:hypothetical protein
MTGGAGRPVSVIGGPPPPAEGSGLRLELVSVGFVSRISFLCRFACLECMTVVLGSIFLDKSSCI